MTFFWQNPVESLQANQIISHGVRYGFDRDRRNVFRVSRSAPVAYGVRGYGMGGRTFERIGSASYTKRRGWYSETRGTYMEEALVAINAKYPGGPPFGSNHVSVDV